MLDAATRCALVADDGVAAVRRTIASGLDVGMKDPREIPEPSSPASASARKPTRDVLPADSRWPGPAAPEAFHGLVGEIVRAIEPHTEADPIALLIQYLACFGNALGRGPYYQVESDRHTSNLFTVLVGETAKARKGTAAGRVREIFSIADELWTRERVHSGLSSGEGVIWAVRDPIKQWMKEGKGAKASRVEKEMDPGVTDKRLMVFEPEFSGALRVMQREGNILSRVIRDAWDRGDLGTLTKNSPARATGALISIVGHITAYELRESLDRTEMANGFANRFIYLCVRRSKLLPHGGRLDEAVIQELGDRTRQAIQWARAIARVTMTPEARAAWENIYSALSEGQLGLFGALTARGEAQVVRLALLYALIDGKAEIAVEHLRAAVALWEYAEASARYIFGDVLGDPVADTILRALRQSGQSGMTRTEISALFGRNRSAAQIDRALAYLAQQGKAKLHSGEVAGQGGRPPERWIAPHRGA